MDGLVSIWKPAQCFLDKSLRAHRRRRLRVLGADMIGRQMRVTKRDRDGERRPATQSAFDSDRTAVQFHELLHQRQPDAGALVTDGPRAPRSRWKRSKSRGSSLCGDAGPGVAHA